jgi:hypothetical protein
MIQDPTMKKRMIQDEHYEGGMPSSMKLGRETYQHIITYGSGVIFFGEAGLRIVILTDLQMIEIRLLSSSNAEHFGSG